MTLRYYPFDMTCDADDEDREADDVTLGRPLTRSFARLLDDSMRGMKFEARMEQLRDVYPEAHAALEARFAGKTLAGAAAAVVARHGGTCSVATAHRLVAKGRHFLELGLRDVRTAAGQLDYAGRLEILAATDPRAFNTLIMVRHGHTQAQVAQHLGCSVPTVARAYKRAIEKVGAEQGNVLERLFGKPWRRSDIPAKAERGADRVMPEEMRGAMLELQKEALKSQAEKLGEKR